MTRISATVLLASMSLTVLATRPLARAVDPVSPAAQAAVVRRTVYVSALDRKGAPVLDLTRNDFVVREGGKATEVLSAGLASERMHIALIVDDNGTGLFRSGVGGFMQRLLQAAQFSVTVITGQALRLLDFTSDVPKLQGALSYLSARPATPEGGQLLASIYETARDIDRREITRPVIVVLTVGGAEHSTIPAHYVLDQLRDSGASLHVFSVTNNLLRSDVTIDRPSTLLDTTINIQEVLGDGPTMSGGRKEQITPTPGGVRGLQALAEELANQYVVTYHLPAGVKPSEKLQVSSARKDVTLRAPTRISRK